MPESKGDLDAGASGVIFDRFELGDDLADLTRHVWVVRWNLPDEVMRRQRVLTYPACNVVFERGRAELFGPAGGLSVQELSGSGWAVGILFRPAAGPLLAGAGEVAPAEGRPIDAAPRPKVEAAMDAPTAARSQSHVFGIQSLLTVELRAWLLPLVPHIDDRGLLINRACELVENDPGLVRTSALASLLSVTPRTLERLTREYLGVTPKWLIERRRLQDAATTLIRDADTDLTQLALTLGYLDYPHFSRSYRAVMGETPNSTRRGART